jgi:hypothetical protein
MWCGTSVGAINATVLTSLAHLTCEEQSQAPARRPVRAPRHSENVMRIARLCTRSEGQVCDRERGDVTNGERSSA